MFFRLPINAVVENWVGDWLNEALSANFDAIDAGRRALISLASLTDERRARLENRRALLQAVREALAAYERLTLTERQSVRRAFEDQLDVPMMIEGACASHTRAMLPEPIQAPLDKLSKAAFGTLSDLGVRRASLAIHFAGSGGRTCAFCGYESVDSGSVADPDWDHYLARSLYPFAAYNLRNLTPMGMACNRNYKHAKDVLRDAEGRPRPCYDPYLHGPTAVHLRGSDPFGEGSRPIYNVTMEGEPRRNDTWNDVFRVKERWLDQLKAKHESCLRDLASQFFRNRPPSDDALEDVLRTRAATSPNEPAYGDDLIRNAVFDHWLDYFTANDGQRARLGALFRDVVAQRGRDLNVA